MVAIHYMPEPAQQETDMALAGGVTIDIPHGRGYLFKEVRSSRLTEVPGIRPPRARQCSAAPGAVVLRRLEDALADRDHVYAVIKLCHNGRSKVGYLAPSVDGLAAIAEAQAMADVAPKDVVSSATGPAPRSGTDRDLRSLKPLRGRVVPRHRIGQGEHRPPGHGRRCRQLDQGVPRAAPRGDPGVAEL